MVIDIKEELSGLQLCHMTEQGNSQLSDRNVLYCAPLPNFTRRHIYSCELLKDGRLTLNAS